MDAGVCVVNVPEPGSFFALWIPIEDPEGGQADFLLTDTYYEDALQVWFELTE